MPGRCQHWAAKTKEHHFCRAALPVALAPFAADAF
jgi:hypothetical protein